MRKETPKNASHAAPLGPSFNFAQHLIELNSGRAAKMAYTDDRGTLSYGELADRVRRMAAVLLNSGLRREDRVLLLMHDNNDWPVSFLGALYAGLVPVAVNTLLTTDETTPSCCSTAARRPPWCRMRCCRR